MGIECFIVRQARKQVQTSFCYNTMATAHKIAVIFYTLVKNQVEYDQTLWATRDAQREKRLEARLKRQAKQLGYELVPIEPKAA